MDAHLFVRRTALFVAFVALVGWFAGAGPSYSGKDAYRPPVRVVYAAANPGAGTLDGYAWSDVAGWISFKGGGSYPYGVTVDATGNLDGRAWSDNLGWLSFKKSEAGSAGSLESRVASTPTNAFIDYSKTPARLVGFGRFLTVCADSSCSSIKPETAGWDGWLSLSKIGNPAQCAPAVADNYCVELTGSNTLSGYGWGDTNVGWVLFDDPGSYNKVDYYVDFVAPSAAPTAGATRARLTFLADRPETSSPGSVTVTGQTGTSYSFVSGYPRLETTGGSVVSGISLLVRDEADTSTLSSFSNGTTRFRVKITPNTGSAAPSTGTYNIAVRMSYTIPPPTGGTDYFDVLVPLELTNAVSTTGEQ